MTLMKDTGGAMAVTRLLHPAQTVLLVVDMQEKLMPVLHEAAGVVRAVERLLKAAGLLGVPVVVSEQYTKGLAFSVPELRVCFPPQTRVLEKTAFGCLGDAAIREHLQTLGRSQVMVCGVETHVCVSQSVHQLLDAGYQAHVIEDATSARTPENRAVGLAKMRQAGAISSSVETALFELMMDCRHDQFKAIQALIK